MTEVLNTLSPPQKRVIEVNLVNNLPLLLSLYLLLDLNGGFPIVGWVSIYSIIAPYHSTSPWKYHHIIVGGVVHRVVIVCRVVLWGVSCCRLISATVSHYRISN
jgi:hypothetical protein